MLDQEYEQLVHYLKGMIADGVQLVHGGHLLDWSDTNILDILNKIEEKENITASSEIKVGDLLKNRYTDQKAVVILITDDSVQMLPKEKVIIFPKDKLWYLYQKSKPGE